MPEQDPDWVRRIHQGPLRLVLVVAGGGMQAAMRLLAEPGASRTLLEVDVPYAESAHRAIAPGIGGSAVSHQRARVLADRAYERALRLSRADGPLAGVACTAALATDRVRRGHEQAFICLRLHNRRIRGCLRFKKGVADRMHQEEAISRVLLAAMAVATGGTDVPPGVELVEESIRAPLTEHVIRGRWVLVHRDGHWLPDAEAAPILVPGSFNPLHHGHARLAHAVERVCQQPVDLELSVWNADKPPLDESDLLRRLAAIQGRFRVVLTGAPTFIEKARLFPGRTFVVGYDTAQRLMDPAYYDADPDRRDAAMAEMRSLACRIVVAGRLAGDGFRTLVDLALPEGCRDVIEPLPAPHFREDVSATELRERDNPQV